MQCQHLQGSASLQAKLSQCWGWDLFGSSSACPLSPQLSRECWFSERGLIQPCWKGAFPAISTLLSPTLRAGSWGCWRAPGRRLLGSSPLPSPDGALQLHSLCLGLQLTTHLSSTFSFSSHSNARYPHAIATPQVFLNRGVKGILTGCPLETHGFTGIWPV